MHTEYGYISFRHIPEGFRAGEKLLVAQFEISGIQRYLLGEGDIYFTEEDICRRSLHIERLTRLLERRLNDEFGKKYKYRTLSLSSGKLICAFSHRLPYDAFSQFVGLQQRRFFASLKGRTELYYAASYAKVRKHGTEKEKRSVMAVLAEGLRHNKYHCTNVLFSQEHFIDTELLIDSLVPPSKAVPKRTGSAVALKFDLDNLGLFFSNIKTFDDSMAASRALKRVLEEAVDTSVYVGGDDIFTVVELEKALIYAAGIYRRLLSGINNSPELELYRESFGISGGISNIEFFSAGMPLVYYFIFSEERLEQAKAFSGKNTVMYEDISLTWEQLLCISDVTERCGDVIFEGLDDRGRKNCLKDIRRLAERILRQNKKHSVLSIGEEKCIAGIG